MEGDLRNQLQGTPDEKLNGNYDFLKSTNLDLWINRSSRIVKSVHGICWEGGGQGLPYDFQKCRLWCIVILRSIKINIFQVLFW